jgi:7-cyano-7-deazaguanine synthase
MRAGLLLSGGMDSIAVAYWKRPDVAITIDYGQVPAQAEIRAARAVCEELRIPHEEIHVDCRSVGTGALAGVQALPAAPVPEWWPYRNQLLLTVAAARGLSLGLEALLLGTVRSDAAHADGTPEFVRRVSALLEAQEGAIRVTAPAIGMSSTELIRAANVPMEVLAWAHSCHTSNLACGRCRGCAKHFEVIRELGLDPY